MTAPLVTYALLRCFDEVRDEYLNVGLVGFTQGGKPSVCVTEDLSRVQRTLPHVQISRLREVLATVPAFFESLSLSPERLAQLTAEWGNGLRLSPPKVTPLVGSVQQTLSTLAGRFIESATVKGGIEAAAPAMAPYRSATSMRIVNKVVSRIKKAGMKERRDYHRDVLVQGRTRSDTKVPVWFPLRVGQESLVDSMDVNASNEPRTVDAARLIAAKAEEAMRGNGYRVYVLVRESTANRKLNTLVNSLIREETNVGNRTASIFSSQSVEEVLAALPRDQFPLLTE